MRYLLIATACILGLGLFAAAPTASASVDACYDWSCDDGVCSFDPSCSSATPFIWKCAWNWGDGTSSGLTGCNSVMHTYSAPNHYPNVQLTIYPWSDEDPDSVTCMVVARNVFGPPLPQSGNCD